MKTTNHLSVRAKHVRTNETSRTGSTVAAPNNQITERNSTRPDPLTGWYALAKNAKAQPVKRYRIQGKQRGQIDGCLLAHVLFVIVAALLIGGLIHVQ
jgi:hypothetical protein